MLRRHRLRSPDGTSPEKRVRGPSNGHRTPNSPSIEWTRRSPSMILLTSQSHNYGLRRVNSNASIWYPPIIDERALACQTIRCTPSFTSLTRTRSPDDELPVRRTAQRLMSEGLDRHDAIHAIGSVLAGNIHDLMRTGSDSRLDQAKSGQDPNKAYFAELERLTAKGWLRSGLSPRGAIGRM
jgi:hypothetical protein